MTTQVRKWPLAASITMMLAPSILWFLGVPHLLGNALAVVGGFALIGIAYGGYLWTALLLRRFASGGASRWVVAGLYAMLALSGLMTLSGLAQAFLLSGLDSRGVQQSYPMAFPQAALGAIGLWLVGSALVARGKRSPVSGEC